MADAPLGAARPVGLRPQTASGTARHARAVPDPAAARIALERVRRLAPKDAMVALDLALACLRGGDPAAALPLFAEVCARHDVADAWLGLAASALYTGDPPRAAAAMQACLSRHVAGSTTRRLAMSICAAAGLPGWCGMDEAGWLHASPAADLTLDGQALRPRWKQGAARIPAGRTLEAACDGQVFLGSPIDLSRIAATEGFVEARAGGLAGWAWHPGNPGRDPVITIAGATELRLRLRRLRDSTAGMRPLARPREFAVAAEDVPAGLLRVMGPDGRDLLGSPIDPAIEQRSAAGSSPVWAPVWADVIGPPPGIAPVIRPVDVVVPVYGGGAQTLACLDSVLASLPHDSRLHVVDDATPDPGLVAALQALARQGRIQLLRQARNRGYPAAVNAGIAAAPGRDVVLLNSDTLVPPGWLQTLSAAARSAPDIGTACPLSNNATILSYPCGQGGNAMPDADGTAALARLARRANGEAVVDLPVAVGFCMFIRRECLDQVGPFREDVFAQGYSEENDFCLRARHRGWRHVAATGAFVAHQGGASFGTAQSHLQARNAAVLNRLHPGYDAMIADWIARDPLASARLRMDARRWRAGRRGASVILVTHAGGGGVDRVIAARAAALRGVGIRPVILRPEDDSAVVGEGGATEATPNLRFAMPSGLPSLVRLLRGDRPSHVEYHHMLGQHPALFGLAGRLQIPHEVHVHDYAWFCPRIALVPERSYCGEPAVSACEACLADHGSNTGETISVAALVARSAGVLRAARRVVAPAPDVARRLHRHFPPIRAEVTPWEDDGAVPPPAAPRAVRRVCIIGGIGTEKGYDVLLGCLRDIAARRLDLSFALVGHSQDDGRLLDAGPIHITGRYAPEEAEALIHRQAADIAFLPSIWPETWCFTLGHAWRAGLRAAVFDLGTPAERVRRTGWGWVLPLGLPPASINDWLLRLNSSTQRHPARREHIIALPGTKSLAQDANV